MKKIIWTTILLLSALISYGQSISMQSSNRGFSIQAAIGTGNWKSKSFGVPGEGGTSFGLSLAYGVNTNLAFVASASTILIQPEEYAFLPFGLEQIGAGPQYTFGSTTNKFRVSTRALVSRISSRQEILDFFESTNEFRLRGIGFTLGIGCKYHLSLPIALVLDFKLTSGKYARNFIDGVAMDFSHDYQSIHIGLGVSINISQL